MFIMGAISLEVRFILNRYKFNILSSKVWVFLRKFNDKCCGFDLN
jgi:hypothetical protein